MSRAKATTRKARKPAKAKAKTYTAREVKQLAAQAAYRERRALMAKYNAAQTTPGMRKHWGAADALSAKEANSLAVRRKLRERCQAEFDNNPDFQGIVLTHANQFLGVEGPSLQAMTADDAVNRAIDDQFRLWAAAIRLADKLRVMKICKVVRGEPFAVARFDPLVKHPVKVRITTHEPDQCTAPSLKGLWDNNYIDGITLDPLGNPMSYDMLREHPGDAYCSLAYDTLLASQVIHWFRADRPGQARGIPEVSACLQVAAIRNDLTLDVAAAYRIAALFGVLLETEDGEGTEDEPGTGSEAGGTGEDPDLFQMELPRGLMSQLPAGVKASQVKPEHPTAQHQPFTRDLLRSEARPLCMPYHMAAGDYADSNYATARLGSQDFRIAIGVERKDCEVEVLDRLLDWFLTEAILIPGLLPPNVRAVLAQSGGMLPHRWQWPAWDYIDPATDAAANKTRMESGEASLADIRPDWRDVIRQRAIEAAYAKQVASEIGGAAGASSSPPGEPAAAPEQAQATTLPAAIQRRRGVQIRAAAGKQRLRLDSGAKSITFAAAAQKPLKSFEMLAYSGGEMVLPGFEQYQSVVDLTGVTVAADKLPILLDHRPNLRVGHTDRITIDGQQISAAGVISGTSPAAREVVQTAANAFPWQASIGGEILKTDFIAEGQKVQVNGREFTGPLYVHRQTILREISFVPLGADRETIARIAAAAGGGQAMQFEQWILNYMSIEEFTALDDAAKAIWQQVYDATGAGGETPAEDPAAPAEAPMPAAAPTPVAAARTTRRRAPQGGSAVVAQTPTQARNQLKAAMLEETKRVNAIRKLEAGYSTHEAEVNGTRVNVIEHAIENDWTPDQAEIVLLRASRGNGPLGYAVPSKGNVTGEILEAAICRTIMLPSLEKRFKPEVLEASYQHFRTISLQQVILHAAAQNGYRAGPGERVRVHNIRGILEAAFQRGSGRALHASWTPISLPGIFSNTANKAILDGYEAAEGPWREVAGIESVSDFKQFTSYRLLDNMEYEEVGPAGEIPHGTLDEESYTRQAKTYAKMLALTLQDIVNDDMGAFNRLRTILGMGSMMKLRKVFWTEFMSDASTFWTSTRTNYIEGATTNLGTDGVGLGLGVKAFRQMRSPSTDGSKYIEGKPEILLVPPELETNADAYYQNRNFGPGTAISAANTHAAKYRPVIVPELSDSSYTGYSTTAWFLLRNPAIAPAVVVSFLDGQQTPVIEDTDADFNTLGVQFRGYHHFGADQAEYLCGVKSKGAA